MEFTQIKRWGKELAKYFVYYCEQENYIEQMNQFRMSSTRLDLITAIHSLQLEGEPLSTQSKQPPQITPKNIELLCEFIRTAKKNEVRQLHTLMIEEIAQLELEKIHQMEQYMIDLLRNEEGGK